MSVSGFLFKSVGDDQITEVAVWKGVEAVSNRLDQDLINDQAIFRALLTKNRAGLLPAPRRIVIYRFGLWSDFAGS
jgi:hypothetical protein